MSTIAGIQLDDDARDLLRGKVRELLDGIAPHRRSSLALLVTERDGVKVVPRSRLLARLQLAGRAREAREAMTMVRDNGAIVAWAEVGAVASLFVFRLTRRRSLRTSPGRKS